MLDAPYGGLAFARAVPPEIVVYSVIAFTLNGPICGKPFLWIRYVEGGDSKDSMSAWNFDAFPTSLPSREAEAESSLTPQGTSITMRRRPAAARLFCSCNKVHAPPDAGRGDLAATGVTAKMLYVGDPPGSSSSPQVFFTTRCGSRLWSEWCLLSALIPHLSQMPKQMPFR